MRFENIDWKCFIVCQILPVTPDGKRSFCSSSNLIERSKVASPFERKRRERERESFELWSIQSVIHRHCFTPLYFCAFDVVFHVPLQQTSHSKCMLRVRMWTGMWWLRLLIRLGLWFSFPDVLNIKRRQPRPTGGNGVGFNRSLPDMMCGLE